MPDWIFDILRALLPAILVAIVASLVTVRLAINRFRQEKWWERKEQTYSQLLETLHHLKKYASEHLDRYHDPDSSDGEKLKELSTIWKDCSAKLSRLEDLASFHLSARAVDILSSYRTQRAKVRNEENTYEWIEGDLAAA